MDKNSVIGLTLIGAILIAFSLLNKPSEKEMKQKQQQQLKELAETTSEKISQDSLAAHVASQDSLVSTVESVKQSQATLANIAQPEVITTLENKLIKVDLSSKGGRVAAVFLKPYETYQDFLNKKSHKNLQLFDKAGSKMSLVFKRNGKEVHTGKVDFKIVKSTEKSLVYRYEPSTGKFIDFIYSIADSSYDLQFNIAFNGFNGEVDPKSVHLDFGINYLLTEKQARMERMTSTVFFETSDGYDYLSEHSDDAVRPELASNWVAFKQSYFSSILIPETSFPAKGTKFSIKNYKEGQKGYNKYIKDYKATVNLGLNSAADGKVKMSWYFGPNDYDVLVAYNKNMEDIVNFGWGLFRWVNIYMIQPIYQVLLKIGMGAGIAILVLTIIVKLILTPVTWKMYVSSAKMRILKPEIDELNKKYPNKEDAMKKQMETMSLYRESGASPLSGCLPMLIQMPILFAAYRFFPSTFSIRQEGFLWAEDLSTFDSVANWSQHIPVLSTIYGNHISLFTLLMAITTLVYTHVNSGNMQQPTQPGMPNMKVMMYIFPVMMIFFFNNYSAGLSYYYFISTLMSIVIMYSIKFFFVDEKKLKEKMELRKAKAQNSGNKKSKFQERLEMMQKQQQARLKKK
jgi:YidC/Oxa1 family membrane protein insertase